MFRKKESTSPEEKLLKIIEEPRGKRREAPSLAFNQKRFAFAKKINLKAVLKKLNLLDLLNRLLLGAGGVATVFLVLTIFKPVERSSLDVIAREDIKLLTPKTSKVLKTELDSYLDTVLKRNMFEVVERGRDLPASAREELSLKLVGIISLGRNQWQAIIEDKDARTYLANEGDTLLNKVRVEKIESNKVVLKKGEEIIELK